MELFPLSPPDDKTVEGWLSAYDRQPKWLPQWPPSTSMALVCVRRQAVVDNQALVPVTTGHVVTSPSMLDQLSNPDLGIPRLFFCVPRSILLEPGVCPGLTEDSFWRSE